MYFFYFDESGSRDPSAGTAEKPKDHLYVLLAVGMYEGQWRPFETEISGLKLELADRLSRRGKGRFELADCEVKSNWVRIPGEREKRSRFLHGLPAGDLTRLTDAYFDQVARRHTVIMASVVDKRFLHDGMTHEALHMTAYEFVLERIQHYMRQYHPKHRALIVMDDTSRQLNRAVAMKHASFQRAGNRNMTFPAIVEYPFFTRSELSNGVQLADLLAYSVYRAFKDKDVGYPYFEKVLGNFYRRPQGTALDGLKVWPDRSPLSGLAAKAWDSLQRETLRLEGQ
ncbi:MAG: DUF3800 domain-containing protein [Deltaproteobacteria bacterium]|nr:DUF3800 domain-containing protein [Deltaproteobacteria bacterium]